MLGIEPVSSQVLSMHCATELLSCSCLKESVWTKFQSLLEIAYMFSDASLLLCLLKILSDRTFQLMMDTDNIFLQNQNSVLHSLEDLALPPRLRGTPTLLHHFLIELWIRTGKLEISQFTVFVTVESPGEQYLAGGTLLKGTDSLRKSIVPIGPLIFPWRPCKQKVTFSETAFLHIVGTRARH